MKRQLNPHFLFNTLNNIDALIRKDPEKASDSVMKLSWIMRYFIYEANADKVPLEKEIEYLESFIELQRIRYKHKEFIDYSRSGAVEGIEVAPMLFVPFVENAFKHGTRRSQIPGIVIRLEVTGGTILLKASLAQAEAFLAPVAGLVVVGAVLTMNQQRRRSDASSRSVVRGGTTGW